MKMAFYLKSKKMDLETGGELVVIFNSKDAKVQGINPGDIVCVNWQDERLFVVAEMSNTLVESGQIGIYQDIWGRYTLPTDEDVAVSLQERPESIELIKKKLLGSKLTESDLAIITRDISDRRIREVEIAYFMSTFFNPGFDDDEVLWAIKGMAGAGDILDFKGIRQGNQIVVDKHSIGGVAGKGITTILVPIIASFGLVIPNTSTRAITAPAGTTDILEVLMPVALNNKQIMESVKKSGACMIWGGALRLSPADDVLIGVEKELHTQSTQKLLASIISKKVSMGITHMIIDIPYGVGTKIERPEDAHVLSDGFKRLFAKVDIKCETYIRHVVAPDGYGIGPALEVRDLLRVYERSPLRPMMLEEVVLDMSGRLLELAGVCKEGEGKDAALAKLDSGEALAKLWEIAEAQGATQRLTSEMITVGEFSHVVKAEKSGEIQGIDNKMVVKVARELGNPKIKEAGIYLHKSVGDYIKQGEDLMTLYATAPERVSNALEILDINKMYRLV